MRLPFGAATFLSFLIAFTPYETDQDVSNLFHHGVLLRQSLGNGELEVSVIKPVPLT